jgi:hypothetical protein
VGVSAAARSGVDIVVSGIKALGRRRFSYIAARFTVATP